MKTIAQVSLLLGGIFFAGPLQAQEGGIADLRGRISIDGSSTVAPISMKVADSFSLVCPKVDVPVGISGTGGGFKRFTKNEIDVCGASRPIKRKEWEQCKQNDVLFIELPVAYDGLTIIVSKENDWVDQLTVDQLKQIFHQDQAAQRWSDLNASWPNEEIKIFAPGTDSGTFDYFKEVVVGKQGSIRSDMSVSEDDNQIVLGVSQNKLAIGFFGAAYYFGNKDSLKALKIVNPSSGEAVLPTADSIENGSYAPFSRPLFIYVNRQSIGRPEVKVFVNHYLDHAAKLARKVGYVALPPEIYQSAKSNAKRRKTGTHFMDEQGEKRHGSTKDIFVPENLTK